MKSKKILTKIFEDILVELNEISDNDISKLEGGEYSISVKIVRNKLQSNGINKIDNFKTQEIVKQLGECKTREQGYDILFINLKTKKELEGLARYLDVSVMKQDKADYIKEKIIEATVGAVLRSNAIQGKS